FASPRTARSTTYSSASWRASSSAITAASSNTCATSAPNSPRPSPSRHDMGQELACTLRYRRQTLAGKAYLESDHVLFRGEERLKVLLKDLTGVSAAAGVLTLEFPGGPAQFELGRAAEKWAERILHPPSRASKLGVKAGATVRLVGDFAPDFLA